jgi:GPH family glycoside/pentoside/hexuronide:cation symporter
LVGLSGLFALAVLPVVGTGWTMALLVWVHSGFLGLFFAFWSLLPDTVDYGERATLVRADGFIFGVAGMISKVSVGIGAALFGWGLSMSGYRPNVEQSAETLAGLKTLMVLPPIAGLSICVVLMILIVRVRK